MRVIGKRSATVFYGRRGCYRTARVGLRGNCADGQVGDVARAYRKVFGYAARIVALACYRDRSRARVRIL